MPLDVVHGITIPQLVALYLDPPKQPRDPFVPGPGERRVSPAEARRILEAQRRGKAASG